MSGPKHFTRDFCDRWLAKAKAYDCSTLNGAFDRYFTLFVCFNRLYDHIGEFIASPERKDNILATVVYPDVVGRDNIWSALGTANGQAELHSIAGLIGSGGRFCIHFDRGTRRHSPTRDANLKKRLTAPIPAERVDAVLQLLYQVRCNLIHGRKPMSLDQLELLNPCADALRRVIAPGREWLDTAALPGRDHAGL